MKPFSDGLIGLLAPGQTVCCDGRRSLCSSDVLENCDGGEVAVIPVTGQRKYTSHLLLIYMRVRGGGGRRARETESFGPEAEALVYKGSSLR